MAEVDVGRLVRDAGVNALIAWLLVGIMAVTAVGSLLAGQYLWGVFASAVVVVVLLPPLFLRSPWIMLPWEVLFLAGIPLLGRSAIPIPEVGAAGTYLSVAALALIVAVELHLFTTVRMSPAFAVAFVVVTTLAVAGVWAVVRWLSDIYFGTTLLLDPMLTESEVERALMFEFVASAVIGFLAGVVFEFYIRRRATIRERVPSEVMP